MSDYLFETEYQQSIEEQKQREQQIIAVLKRIANSLEGIEGVLKRSNL